MCGYLGYVGSDASHQQGPLAAGLDLLAHRGPDGRGIHSESWLWLGHRRLAILDLTEAGLQPFWGRDRKTCLLYNGEIYNFKELRTLLAAESVPVSGSGDTAVLAAALDHWGVDRTVPRLNGFWSFAYVEIETRRVTLCRDRFGVKPLYFGRPTADSLCFASEPKAIARAFPALSRRNEKVIQGFVTRGTFFLDGESFVEGIHVFPPASFATFQLGSELFRPLTYWQYPAATDQSSESAAEEFEGIFEDAVRLRYRADVPVGLTVSGGVDSTAVLLASERSKLPGLHAYTSVFDAGNTDEHVRAARVCSLSGVDLQRVMAPRQRWIEELATVCHTLDSPTASPAVLPLRAICERARSDGVIVLLEGQGADEAFSGYVQHGAAWLLSRDGARAGKNYVRSLAALRRTFGLLWLTLWMAKLSSPRWMRNVGGLFFPRPRAKAGTPSGEGGRPEEASKYPSLHRLLVGEHSRTILPTLLHYGDGVSMSASVEMRQPFLDFRLVEWIFRQPDTVRIRDGETKWVIRRYLERHGAGFVNAWKKEGFTTPVSTWIGDRTAEVRDDWLCATDSISKEILGRDALDSMIRRAARGNRIAAYHVFRLLSLELWLKGRARGSA